MTALPTESLKSDSKNDIRVSHVFSLARLATKRTPQQGRKMTFLHVDPPSGSRLWPSPQDPTSGLIQAPMVRFSPATLLSSCFLPSGKVVSTRQPWRRWRLVPGRGARKRWGERRKGLVQRRALLGWWFRRQRAIYKFSTVSKGEN